MTSRQSCDVKSEYQNIVRMEYQMNSGYFYAMLSRMKYINRWGLMRNTKNENLSEHSLETAFIAHALGIINNEVFHGSVNAEHLAVLAMYHDATEISTGDMPTPVKYYNDAIKESFKMIEKTACYKLLNKLPDEMKPQYEPLFFRQSGDEYIWKLVKAADKLSALIKCMEETSVGNPEFSSAYESTKASVDKLAADLPEVERFLSDFLPAYGKNLDQLQYDR